MSGYLSEAQEMLDDIRDRDGDTLAVIDWIQDHPEHRLTLEALTPSVGGALFEEIPDYSGGDSLPVHLRMERSFYLRHTKDFEGVQVLLEAMNRLYGVPGHTVDRGLKVARKRFVTRVKKLSDVESAEAEVLASMTEYFLNLVDQLPELEAGKGITNLGSREVGAADFDMNQELPVHRNYTVYADTCVPDEDYLPCGSTTRYQMVHSPGGDLQQDWAMKQSYYFKKLFFGMKKCSNLGKLTGYCADIRKAQEHKWYGPLQLKVLWSMYFMRRDDMRVKQKRDASNNYGKTCSQLLSAIDRQTDSKKMGRVGACLYNWNKGYKFDDREMPGKMSHGEWSVVWDAHKAKKLELQRQEAEIQALID